MHTVKSKSEATCCQRLDKQN